MRDEYPPEYDEPTECVMCQKEPTVEVPQEAGEHYCCSMECLKKLRDIAAEFTSGTLEDLREAATRPTDLELKTLSQNEWVELETRRLCEKFGVPYLGPEERRKTK